MLARLRHCIPSSTSMEMYNSFDPHVEYKNENRNILGNHKVSLTGWVLHCVLYYNVKHTIINKA